MRRSTKKTAVEYGEFLPKFGNDGHHLARPVVDWSDPLEEQYARRELHELLGRALDELKPVDRPSW